MSSDPSTAAPATAERKEAPVPGGYTQLRLSALALGIVAAIAIGFILLGLCIRPQYAFLCGLISFFGAVGGLLYAIRESELVVPHITDHGIHVGCIGDCFYGMAGAYAIFLLLPNFSETAQSNLSGIVSQMIYRDGAGGEMGNGADLLEIIAVAIVGGFAGHFVMRRASESLLQKVEKVEQGTKQLEDTVKSRHEQMEREFTDREARLTAVFNDSRKKLEAEVAAARAESEALSLVVQQLNPHWPNPDLEDFKRAAQQLSDDGLARLVDSIGQRLRREKDRIAARAIPILKTLRQLSQESMAAAGCKTGSGGSCLTRQQIEQELTLLLAQAMGYAGRPDLSARFLDKVLRELPPDNDAYAGRLQSHLARFRQTSGKSRPKKNGQPAAALARLPKKG
jgi:predicted transcriptional regulator